MPYIEQRRREEFETSGLATLCHDIRNRDKALIPNSDNFQPSDLAFIVYVLLRAAAPNGRARFERRNAMMGAVLDAVAEYRRRVHEPMEDDAIRRNGDIA